MSLEAIAWALVQAPDVPPQCVSLLIGLANHADSRGRGAYAGQKLLADYARKSDRSVRNDLAVLMQRGLIRPGNQSLAGHIPADCRPVVYDLALERKQASGRKRIAARQQASAATSDRFTEPQAPDQGKPGGGGSTLPHGSQVPAGSEEQRERKPASYKPTDNQTQNSPTESSGGGLGGDAALFDAPDAAATKPRARRQSRPQDAHPRFAEWYDAYPVHKARGDAETAFTKAVAGGADPETLIAAARRYHRDRDYLRGFGKHPATWLNKKCWLDEDAPAPPPGPGSNGHQTYRNPADQTAYDTEELRPS